MELYLRQICAGGPLTDFAISYNDMHNLWGGITLTLAGTGRYERAERLRGVRAPTRWQGVVADAHIRELVALLVALAAWQQQVAERSLLPDESLATVTIRYGDAVSTIWEEYARLAEYQRIVQVRNWLLAHGTGLR